MGSTWVLPIKCQTLSLLVAMLPVYASGLPILGVPASIYIYSSLLLFWSLSLVNKNHLTLDLQLPGFKIVAAMSQIMTLSPPMTITKG